MAVDFPASPSTGDQVTLNDIIYEYDGNKWTTVKSLFDRGEFSTGTSTDPGFTVYGDNDTGLYSPGDNQLGISTSGTSRLVIDDQGNFGIGTSSPDSKLHLLGAGYQALTLQRDGSVVAGGNIQFKSVYSGADYWGGVIKVTDGDMDFMTSYRSTTEPTTPRLRITSSGNVGIGTTSPSYPLHVTGSTNPIIAVEDSTNNVQTILRALDSVGYVGTQSNHDLYLITNGTTRAAIDSSGRLLVGTSSVSTHRADALVQIETGGNGNCLNLRARSSDDRYAYINLQDNAGSETAASIHLDRSATNAGTLVFSTTADGASSPTERMRISRNGEATFTTPGTIGYLAQYYCNGGSNRVLAIEESSTDGVHSTSGVIRVGKTTSNSRSINATGTINASGSDYAEYMTKSGNFTINKGDICGITADGLLTNQFLDAISFVVKSTLPSYVGGDTWGLGLPEKSEELETARQAVDRIAFAGQVPVNVTGASPGQYIVPVQTSGGGIKGIAKNEADLTLSEYMKAVGKVIANEDDGRARIIVKVS